MIAGLERPDQGRVLLAGQDITQTPTYLRHFGLMFQDYALFPHLTVGENVAFGLQMAGVERRQVTRRVAEMLDLIEVAKRSGKSTLAIRKNTETTKVDEDFWRKLRHYAFLTACRWIVGVKSEDTQCGAKVLKGDDYRAIWESLCENGLAFDAELLAELAGAGMSWDEVPVDWARKGGSRVHAIGDAVDMLMALFRIRRRLGASR